MKRSAPANTTRTALDGGVASDVAIVKEADGREVVIKQALPKLKVAADWRCDPARSSVEVEALRTMRELLGPGTVPEVLWVDAANHRFAMERIDPRCKNWRMELTCGIVNPATAARAGELLGLLHARSAQRPQLAARFSNRDFFEQLRIEPFFMRIAQRNPQAGDVIAAIVAMLRAPGTALVHGDYSPKNLLVHGGQVVIIDCEVAHWGDPKFDLAFCLSHLLLGGLRRTTPTAAFRRAAETFADAYLKRSAGVPDQSTLAVLVGCLMLARLEGDSPVDYLDELDVAEVKRTALQLVLRPANDLARLIHGILS